ncbi:MAG: BTAD domain-containing putative transcriptional regulator [Trueperaceae bacterium]
MALAVRLLGAPSILLDEGWRPLRANKSAALISFVAHRAAPVRRAEAAAMIWPEADDASARNNLRQLLHQIGGSPLARYLERDHDTLRCAVTSDVQAFADAERDGRFEDVVALYHGPFLQGHDHVASGEFGSWVVSERAVLERRWRSAVLMVIEAMAGAGSHGTAIRLADTLLATDPFDELALRHAMRATAAAGDPHGAWRRYEAFRDGLWQELGIAPDESTESLAIDLRRAHARAVQPDTASLAPAPTVNEVANPGSGHFGVKLGPAFPGHRLTGATASALVPAMAAPNVLVGRGDELNAIPDLLRSDDNRLVTILAPGGMGKTALAAHLADHVADDFSSGVMVARLDRVEGPQAVVTALVDAAGLSAGSEPTALHLLLDSLRDREVLIVLDGFEQHMDQLEVVDALVRGCPAATLLVTSRVRLRHSAERVYELGPLGTQAEDRKARWDPSRPSDAATLFLRSAARVPGGPRLGPNDVPQVETVCRSLGGSPLAIVLAAGWLDTLILPDVLAKVASDWDLLTGSEANVAVRSSDVRGAIQETYLRLDEQDRRAWQRLAILPGSIDRRVAARVAGTGWQGMRRLTDHSVVRHEGDRFELHELVARFGREMGSTATRSAAMKAAVEVWSERLPQEIDPVTGKRARLHPHDLEQALQAWHWAVNHDRWDAITPMVLALARASDRGGRWREFRTSAAEAGTKARSAKGPWRKRVNAQMLRYAHATKLDGYKDNLRAAAYLAAEVGDLQAAAKAHDILSKYTAEPESSNHSALARDHFERADDKIGLADLLFRRGLELTMRGRYDEGRPMLLRSAELNRELGDRYGLGQVLDALCVEPLYKGDFEEALRLARQAEEHDEAAADRFGRRGLLDVEAHIAIYTGPRELAAERIDAFLEREGSFRFAHLSASRRSHFHLRFAEYEEAVRESLALERSAGNHFASVDGFNAHQRLARAYVALGKLSEAARHLGVATSYVRVLDAPRFVPRIGLVAGCLALALGDEAEAECLLMATDVHPLVEPDVRHDLDRTLTEAGWTAGAHHGTRLGDAELIDRAEKVCERLRS